MEAVGKPLDGTHKSQILKVDHKVDSATTSDSSTPVEKLVASDGEDPLSCTPPFLVARILLSSQEFQHLHERDGSELIRRTPDVMNSHDSSTSFDLKLTHCFMLMM